MWYQKYTQLSNVINIYDQICTQARKNEDYCDLLNSNSKIINLRHRNIKILIKCEKMCILESTKFSSSEENCWEDFYF